ncbi:MAG: wax ester/triacylglycerol synthase family O-acyltransferase [Solirubrobacterales bacterium]
MAETHSMSSADAAWLHMDQPTNLMVITGALWFEEPVDWERAREVLRTRLVEPFPRFRQRVVEGSTPLSGPHWEDDERFDLDLHIHRVALPAPGDRTALQELVADLMAEPLDPSKPLWHFHFVEGLEQGAAIVTRMHHCIADGIALARVLLSLTDEAPDEVGIDPPAEGDRRGGPLGPLLSPIGKALSLARGAAGTVAHEAVEIARNPSELVDLAGTARDDAEVLAKQLVGAPDPPSPLKGELGVAQKANWSRPIPLERVKEVGHAAGATVNDVVLCAISGALRIHLRDRGAEVEELTAFVPFNLRPLDRPLPADLGNRFGLVFLRLPVGVEDRALRLAEVHERMEAIKDSPEGPISYGLLEVIGRTPTAVEHRIVEMFTGRATAVVTNVPGPQQPVYFAGSPVRGVLVWAPRSGSVGLSVSIFSYAGEITVGLMVDAGLVPDPGSIIADVEREMEALGAPARDD